jgi:NAD(P)-dependent dehydrogenase (short-subunit alcohol dehydrogenase family)
VSRLEGKVALVSGAARGMGAAEVRRLHADGASVVAGDILDDEGKALADSLGDRVRFVHLDVTSEESWQAAVAQTEQEFGKVDVLVNNAGILRFNAIADTPLDELRQVLDVNLIGCFLGMKTAIPALKRAGGGSIINTASFVAIMGAAVPQIAYTASKGGVLAMTREIAVEFARQNIRANSLCPGPVETPLLAELLADPARRNRRLVHIPMGRFARAEEMANAALFLASDESSFITGTSFLVDGGITGAYITPE